MYALTEHGITDKIINIMKDVQYTQITSAVLDIWDNTVVGFMCEVRNVMDELCHHCCSW